MCVGNAPKAKRRAARQRLASSLSASVFEDGRIVQMRHSCALGCHSSAAAAREEILADLLTAHLDLFVAVPACNRWTKLYAPLAYWHVGTVLGYLPSAFAVIAQTMRSETGVLDVDALVGIIAEDVYEHKKKIRFQKASTWLNNPLTMAKQATGIATLLPVVALMGRFFDDAKLTARRSVLDFVTEATSPAHGLARRILELLADPNDTFWLVARGRISS
jgi:hypothetical protein